MTRITNLFIAATALLLLILNCSTAPPTGNSLTTTPTVAIGSPIVYKGEIASFTISLSGSTSLPVTFRYRTVDVTARADSEYLPLSGHATIASGSTKDTIRVQTKPDALNANDKTFKLVIDSLTNAKFKTGTGTDAGICRIVENSELTVRDTAAVKGDTASIIVSLNLSPQKIVSFHYRTVDSNGVSGVDYEAVHGIDSIPVGSLRTIVRIPTFETPLNGRAFKLTIDTAVNAVIARATGSCRLTEIPSLSVANASPVLAGDTALFTVSLSKYRASNVIFHHTTSDSIAHSGTDYEATSGVDTIPSGGTGAVIKVATKLGAQPSSDFVFKLNISAAERATIAQPTGICRIAPLPKLSVSDTAIVQGALALFVVSLSEPSLAPVTFHYKTFDSSALAAVDYFTPADSIGQITAGADSVIVPVLTRYDAPFVPNKFFKLTISAATHATVDRGTALCRIDQGAPAASFIRDVRPILVTANCARNGCHGGGASSGGLNLGSVSFTEIRNANGTDGSFLVPNSAETSRFYRILTNRPIPPNQNTMPKGETPLAPGDQEKIRNWINQGARDN